jgi:hypothetical protein
VAGARRGRCGLRHRRLRGARHAAPFTPATSSPTAASPS